MSASPGAPAPVETGGRHERPAERDRHSAIGRLGTRVVEGGTFAMRRIEPLTGVGPVTEKVLDSLTNSKTCRFSAE